MVEIEEATPTPEDFLAGLSRDTVTELRKIHERGDTSSLHEGLKLLGMTKMGARAKAIAALQAMPPLPPPPPPVEIKKGFLSSSTRLPRGARVLIQGLKARPELNGKEGTVGTYDKETGRYKVVLDEADGGDVLALKPAALTEVRPVAAPALVDITDPAAALAALSSHPPLRCPPSLLTKLLPRLPDVSSKSSVDELKKMLSGGQAFVVPAKEIVGDGMLRWDFEYLLAHLPAQQKYDVFYVRDRLVMSHSIRYSGGDLAGANGAALQPPTGDANGSHAATAPPVIATAAAATDDPRAADDKLASSSAAGPFAQSKVSFLTFTEFLEASRTAEAETERARAKAGGDGAPPTGKPYLGLDLFKRASKQDQAGRHGQIGEALVSDVNQFRIDRLLEWGFPVVSSMHLFVGSEGTCYHTHYDLNPNLHFQLVGRKRFILFPPDQWPHLCPFPCHHDLDRRSQVNLDAPDSERFPSWSEAKGMAIELSPGDCLYIPPFWFHHVQTVTTPCVSMAVWCYDQHPDTVSGGRDLMPSSGAAKAIAEHKKKAKVKAVKEQVKLVERDVLRGTLPESAGKLASVAVQAARETPDVEPTVANCFGGHFYGLCAAGAELSLVRWVEQLFGQMIVMPEAAEGAGDGAGKRAADSGEAYAGAAKERAVAGWLQRVGDVSRLVDAWEGGPKEEHPISKLGMMSAEAERAEQARLGLHPLKVPFGQLITELYVMLQTDLAAGPKAVAPFLLKLTAESRLEPAG